MDFTRIMQVAQNGALEAVAREYGLAPGQMTMALEALAPALAAMMKASRSAGWPPAGFPFGQNLTGASAPPDFDTMLLGPATMSARSPMMDWFFGPPDLRRKIASLASGATDLPAAALEKMMPALTLATLQAIAMSQGQSGHRPGVPSRREGPPDPGKPKGPLDRYEEEQARASATGPGLSAGVEQIAQMMDGFVAMLGNPSPEPSSDDLPGETAPGKDLVEPLMDFGLRLGGDYCRAMEALIDRNRPE